MSTELTKESFVLALKKSVNIITLLECRVEEFNKELIFYMNQTQELNQSRSLMEQEKSVVSTEELLYSALRRLDHEIMFLCIETFSLYQGLLEQKSLFSKFITAFGKDILSINKTPVDRNFCIFIDDDNWEEEEKKAFTEAEDKRYLEMRKEFRNAQGLKLDTQQKLGNVLELWKESFIEPEIIQQLKTYRGEFAHRLDSFAKLDQEYTVTNPSSLQARINCVSYVLEQSKQKIQKLISHLSLEHYEGITGFYYDSMSRLKLLKELENDKT